LGIRERKKLSWNRPEVKIRLDGKHLVEMFQSLGKSILPTGGVYDLRVVEDIPEACDFHSEKAAIARDVGDVDTYFRHAQLAALLKKVEFPLFEALCEQNAMVKWHAAEAGCKEMNEKFAEILAKPHTNSHPELAELVVDIRRELEALLGGKPPPFGEIAPHCGYGPGADSSHDRREGHAAYKLLCPSLMPDMLHMLPELMEYFPELMAYAGNPAHALARKGTHVILPFDHARLEFVPKNVREHRTIEIMPTLATFVGQGYDHYIRSRLKSIWGIDLRDQMPNQHLAFLGSLQDGDDSPVTLDLSAASDRISIGLIRLVLPIEWSRVLWPLRARDVQLKDGTFHTLEKFSSMGNSLTFSLQTAIYSAIVLRAYRAAGLKWKQWRVYGDDIIVVKNAATAVIRDLELLGFKLNLDKSFIKGPFRESCGADYLHGTNVRPFYIKKPIRTVGDVYKYVNTLQMVIARAPIPAHSYGGLFNYLLSLVPKPFRLVGPSTLPMSSCFWTPYEVAAKVTLTQREVKLKMPEHLALRVTLLIGANDSSIEERRAVGLTLRKNKPRYTPSQLLDLRQRIAFERFGVPHGYTENGHSEVPTGIFTYLMRRPGPPGHDPLDGVKQRMLIPIW
jgi:hypothetical protein